jgi:hypothetical protein
MGAFVLARNCEDNRAPAKTIRLGRKHLRFMAEKKKAIAPLASVLAAIHLYIVLHQAD